MKKRAFALILTLGMMCALTAPASAATMGKIGQRNTISCGERHTAAIDENGVLWTWGRNDFGQLGRGNTKTSSKPVQIMDNVAWVSCAKKGTAAIKTDGTLWVWGSVGSDELHEPVKVMDNVAAVSGLNYQLVVLKSDGTLWEMGKIDGSEAPTYIMEDVVAVSRSSGHTAVIKTDGSLWTWGYNDYGQVGNGEMGDGFRIGFFVQDTPVKIMDNVVAVSCGVQHTAAVQADGSLWTWGAGSFGQLGNGGKENSPIPVKVLDNVATVSCGERNTAAIRADGTLWMWGRNQGSALGNDSQVDAVEPIKVLDNVVAVSCEEEHTGAIRTDGTVWMWGWNSDGQLGNHKQGNETDAHGLRQTVPIQIDLKAALPGAVTLPGATAPIIGGVPTAYASTQSVLVDGKAVTFQCYALKDASGNDTNYIKLRDVASVLSGTAVQFNVGWDGAVNIETGKGYMPNGSEMMTPFSGDRAYEVNPAETRINGSPAALDSIVLKDDAGGAFTYYKLRDLGAALGFKVDWTAEKGIFIETK